MCAWLRLATPLSLGVAEEDDSRLRAMAELLGRSFVFGCRPLLGANLHDLAPKARGGRREALLPVRFASVAPSAASGRVEDASGAVPGASTWALVDREAPIR